MLSLIFSSGAVLGPEPTNPEFVGATKSFVAAKDETYIVDAQWWSKIMLVNVES
jgi:hypothetical protein